MVWALDYRWRISRSVKNACSVGPSVVTVTADPLRSCFCGSKGGLRVLLRRVQPWCLEVEELRRPDRERLYLLHDLCCLRWHLLGLTPAGFGLGREVDDHAPLAV